MKKEYYYKGNKLYNIHKLDWDYCGNDILANYKDNNGKEKLGRFKIKELAITLKEVEFPLNKDGSINWGNEVKSDIKLTKTN